MSDPYDHYAACWFPLSPSQSVAFDSCVNSREQLLQENIFIAFDSHFCGKSLFNLCGHRLHLAASASQDRVKHNKSLQLLIRTDDNFRW